MQYVYMAIVGFIVGLLARAILPGTQSLGLIMTTLLGIAGSYVAGFIGQAFGWYEAGQGAGFIGSIVGAILLLFIVGKLRGRSTSDT
ncbi:GlsB/YeaQ/YmgE family stress response membrane protein [Piscinibacter sp. XHJ-5]|uniref:GlsB/YeaQ/YmgE family stress response membrane protein n=1 Tax=Piscinibacter sp. XHJ-5 TaxID=3037797 RepID=UPI002453058E|nr:GlsB/YeaQ/YmgE family stress response membrane protein [Piscinibacter sp. XHJ-5]